MRAEGSKSRCVTREFSENELSRKRSVRFKVHGVARKKTVPYTSENILG